MALRLSLPPRLLPCLAAAAAVAAAAGCGSGSTVTTTVVRPAPAARKAVDVQRQFVETVHALSPSVVQIQTRAGLGSGVVYDGDGDIVTNNHVVGGSRTFTV